MVKKSAASGKEPKKKFACKNGLIPKVSRFFSPKKQEEVIQVSSGSEKSQNKRTSDHPADGEDYWGPTKGSWEGVQDQDACRKARSLAKESLSLKRKRKKRQRQCETGPAVNKQLVVGETSQAGSEGQFQTAGETSPPSRSIIVDVNGDNSASIGEADAHKREATGNAALDGDIELPISVTGSKYFQHKRGLDSEPAALRRRKKRRPQKRCIFFDEPEPICDSKRRKPAAADSPTRSPAKPSGEVKPTRGRNVEEAVTETCTGSPQKLEESSDAGILPSWIAQARVNTRSGATGSSSGSEKPSGPVAEQSLKSAEEVEDELSRMCRLSNKELQEQLPEIGESAASLELTPSGDRNARIQTALAARSGQRAIDFRESLDAKQREIREEKNRGQVVKLATPVKRLGSRGKKDAGDSPIAISPTTPKAAALPGFDSPINANMRISLWEPPVSPFSLLEEALYNDPWKVLVACMLLNKTTGKMVRKVLWRLFGLAPTPEAAAEADTAVVEAIIQPLGLFRKRAIMFKRFSQEYLQDDWSDPQQLHGIGRYAADAYYIFCRNQWRDRPPPQDKDLLKYYEWLKATGGEGEGYEREVFGIPSSSASGGSGAVAQRPRLQQDSQSADNREPDIQSSL